MGRVVALEVRAIGGAGSDAGPTRSLRLSTRHFLPVVTTSGLHHKYAEDVYLGDRLMLADDLSEPLLGEVVGKRMEYAIGMFNPYTKVGSGCGFAQRVARGVANRAAKDSQASFVPTLTST